MYVYGFYKAAGVKGIEIIGNSEARQEMEERSGRTLSAAVLWDLARSDIQAFLLYRLSTGSTHYEYAFQKTLFARQYY